MIHAYESVSSSAVYIGPFFNVTIHLNNSHSFAFTHTNAVFLPLFIWQALSKLCESINDMWYSEEKEQQQQTASTVSWTLRAPIYQCVMHALSTILTWRQWSKTLHGMQIISATECLSKRMNGIPLMVKKFQWFSLEFLIDSWNKNTAHDKNIKMMCVQSGWSWFYSHIPNKVNGSDVSMALKV